jgi:Pyruvate/2-oxoacid:ferredoxin oxidoreductase gamma subunit
VAKATRAPQSISEHIVEVISDSGEGAQRCGQSLAAIAARMGNGIWTTEIIPAEIQPPARSVAGASGIRIRMGSQRVTNGGDQTDLVVAFNEQVLLGRVQAKELKPGATILLESMWQHHRDPAVVASYTRTVEALRKDGYRVYEVPLEALQGTRERPAQGQEHVRAGPAVQPVRAGRPPGARADRTHLRQEGRQGHRATSRSTRPAPPGPRPTSTSSSAFRPSVRVRRRS